MESTVFKHSFKTLIQESIGLSVYNCGFQKCEAKHSWGPAMRDHYLIHYIFTGKGEFNDGERVYRLSAGDLFLAVPSKIVYYCANGNEPWEYYWVGFNGVDAERLLTASGLSEAKPVIHFYESDSIKESILDIYHSNGRQTADEARMTAKLYWFLATLMDCRESVEPHVLSGSGYIEKAILYIQRNYSRDIGTEEIAGSAGISRSHLYRLFMTHISMPPNEFLVRFRINQACVLLRDRGLSVSETAFSTGFNDQLYFSRVFKKYKGVSPSKYSQSVSGDS